METIHVETIHELSLLPIFFYLKINSTIKRSESFRFTSQERLKSAKILEELFSKGQSKVIFPFRLVWLTTPLPSTFPVQCAVSVSKRTHPKAVDRNRIKRQMREAYRLHKHLLYQSIQTNCPDTQVAMMLIFINRKDTPYVLIEKKVKSSLQFLAKYYRHPSNQ